MCECLTFAVPEQYRECVPELLLGPPTEPLFAVEPFSNEGGGHEYDAGWATFFLERGGCSCGVLSERDGPQVSAWLAKLAGDCGQLEFLVHWHSGDFAAERFPISGRTTISASDLAIGRVQLHHDVKYHVQSAVR
jgi:hypothetical protein